MNINNNNAMSQFRKDVMKIKLFMIFLFLVAIYICVTEGLGCSDENWIEPLRHSLLWFILAIYNFLLLIFVVGIRLDK